MIHAHKKPPGRQIEFEGVRLGKERRVGATQMAAGLDLPEDLLDR